MASSGGLGDRSHRGWTPHVAPTFTLIERYDISRAKLQVANAGFECSLHSTRPFGEETSGPYIPGVQFLRSALGQIETRSSVIALLEFLSHWSVISKAICSLGLSFRRHLVGGPPVECGCLDSHPPLVSGHRVVTVAKPEQAQKHLEQGTVAAAAGHTSRVAAGAQLLDCGQVLTQVRHLAVLK